MALKINSKVIHSEFLQKLVLFFSAICTLVLLGWVLWFCQNGIDFADEAFYLVWIANPFKYKLSVTQFGFIYHPLYLLLDGSIVALRQLNILITFFLTALLANFALKSVLDKDATDNLSRYVIAGAISTASLIFLVLWLPTPSYNWLAFQSLLIAAIGLIFSGKTATAKSIAGWTLIGVGGWLAFMAKPTTAVAICLCASIYIAVAGKLNFRLLLIPVIVASMLLGISALAIDGSVLVFIDRLRGGFQQAMLLGGGHNVGRLFRIDELSLGQTATTLLTASTVIFFIVAYLPQIKVRIFAQTWHVFALALGVPIFFMAFGIYHTVIVAGSFQHLLIWSVPFAAILLGFSLSRFKGLAHINRSQWALTIVLSMLPYSFALGTSNNYWYFSGMVGVFWVIAGIIFLCSSSTDRNLTCSLIALGLATQLVTATQIMSGMEGPYYQPMPLRKMDYRVELGTKKAGLVLAESFGRYISDAIKLADKAQFRSGTPMIDLTGHSPGVLFSIGAVNTGLPWIIGDYSKNSGFAYSGSETNAVAALTATSCEELANAWILIEPDGPVKLSSKILSSYGADVSRDFEVAGSFETEPIVGGFTPKQTQYMLKPIRSQDAAMKACMDTKAKER